MASSVLTDVKKTLGLDDAYTAFDLDILMYINSAFSTLNQLGIGPEDGFSIADKTTTWDSFFGTSPKYNIVKTYVSLSTRLIFDPPATSFAIDAIKSQLAEHAFRINLIHEAEWVPPSSTETELILDGGEP